MDYILINADTVRMLRDGKEKCLALKTDHGLEILSESKAITAKPDIAGYNVMIRISDYDWKDQELAFPDCYTDILSLKFPDIGCRDTLARHSGSKTLVDEEQAKKLLTFFEEHRACDHMVIHCWAGISRSSAVGLLWTRFKGNKEAEALILENDLFQPNPLVLEDVGQLLFSGADE